MAWALTATADASPRAVPIHASDVSLRAPGGYATTLEDIENALDADEPFVAQVGAELLKDAYGMLKGGCPDGTVMIYTGPQSEDLDSVAKESKVEERHVPGILSGHHRLRRCFVISFAGHEAVLAPAVEFVKVKAPKARDKSESIVFRASFHEHYAESFESIRSKPARALRQWASRVLPSNLGAIIDSWGWVAKDGTEVTGLVRATMEAGNQLLASSGRAHSGVALFLTPVNWNDIGVCQPSLLWVNKEASEDWSQYLGRVRKDANEHGLVANGNRLGLRLDALDPRIVPRRSLWHFRGAGPGWLLEDVEQVLIEGGFGEIEIQSSTSRRGGVLWTFLASRADFRDFVPLQLTDEDGNEHVAEATKISRKRSKGMTSAIPTERTHSFKPAPLEDFIKTAKPKGKANAGTRKVTLTTANTEGAASASPLEDMVVDGDEATVLEPAGAKRSLPGDEAQASIAAPKQPKIFKLPDTAQIVENRGKGNCLFEAVAQGVSEIESKRIGHRQVRAALADWLASHSDAVEPHWDGLAPDGTKLNGGFMEYTDRIRQQGAYGGYLELYAVSVAHALNIIVVHQDCIHKFPAKADSTEMGHFLCLKYEAAHYEFVRLLGKEIAQLWLGASVPKFSGNRGGGGLAFSDYADCVSSAPWRTAPASRLRFSAYKGSTSSAKTCSKRRRSSTRPMTSAESSKRARLVAGPSARSNQATASQHVSEDEEDVANEGKADQQTVKVRPSKYLVKPGVYQFRCEQCPYVGTYESAGSASTGANYHLTSAHGGVGCPGRRKHPKGLQRLSGKDVAAWRCPVPGCRVGISCLTRTKLTEGGFAMLKNEHRKAKHSELSISKWLAFAHRRVDISFTRKVRAHHLNKSAAQRVINPRFPDGFVLFSWPRVVLRQKRERLCLQSAGQCPTCCRCFWNTSKAETHRCDEKVDPKFVKHRVSKLQKLMKKPPARHGMEDEVLQGLCRAAIAALESRPKKA